MAPELADVTCGAGAGERLPLLNQILARADSDERWLVVSDDDFAFVRGNLGELLALSRRAGFGLAQPAHARGSNGVHPITYRRHFSRARVTTFVECGPLFVVSPGWRARITPFPAERGMGWGLELDFARLRPDGCLLGIVDAVRIRHLGAVGSEYETRARTEAMRAELAEHGVREWSELQQTLQTWWVWQRTPPRRR